MSEEETIRVWQKLLDAKQTVRKFRNALAGDGGGTIDVAGEPGYIWCRYSADQSKVSKVFNIIAPGLPENFPIVVGRRFPTDEFEQVLAVNWTLYQDIVTQDTVDNFTTGNHGESHNAASGADPAPIDLRNIVEMRGRAQAVANLTIDVERGQYVFGYADVRRFPGEMIDLTASVPGVVGHRFVLVYVDGVTNTLGSTVGAIVPLAVAAPIPDITANTIPICLVDLENAQTTIVEDDIYDWRFLWDLVSWNAPWLIGTNAERLVLVVGDLAELTHFAETDTDQVWQVWEGAWRIVYPPSVLAASDGDPGTPWLVGATGVLTGSQNLVLDDGVGDSPQLQLVGGSNDDTADILLDNSGVAGQSDLAINLPGTDANSVLNIRDQTAADKVHIDAEGSIFQFVYDAITNTFSVWQTLEHNSTGVPVAGFAGRVLYRLESGAGMTDAAAMQVEWEDPTSGSEDSLIRFYLRKAGVILGEFIRFAGEGIRTVVAGTDMFPNDDGRGLAARFVNSVGLTTWTAHFRSGETTGPGNGTLVGYSWQGAPFGGAAAGATYSGADDYFQTVGAAATKHFLSKAITNAAASWQGKEIGGRIRTGYTTEIGFRIDANDDNNWVEMFTTGVLVDGRQRLDFRYRDNGGGITTVTSNVIVPADHLFTVGLFVVYIDPNYYAQGVIVAEDTSSVDISGFLHQLNGNWAVGPPTAGRAGFLVANAGNGGAYDWFYNSFT